MSNSKSLLLYQDEPAVALLKLIMVGVPALLLVTSLYLWSSGERDGGLALLFEALFIGLIFWSVFPRRYQVYEDHLRIVLGGPFAVKIRFEQITDIEVTRRTGLTVNFCTSFKMTYVLIVMKHGFSIAITPTSNDLFADNANRAISEWARTSRVDSPTE